ncbi:MAG: hypothetical protein ACOYXU_01975 [Nitrospirota bacterium]
MKSQHCDLAKTLAGKEYDQFLSDYGFSLALDEDGESFSCTVVRNSEILLAFTYQMNFGENLVVAEIGAPVDVASISSRSNGWSLIGEVWKDAYSEFHAARRELPYPHRLDRKREIALIERALREFMNKVRSKEVSVGHPTFRMDA